LRRFAQPRREPADARFLHILGCPRTEFSSYCSDCTARSSAYLSAGRCRRRRWNWKLELEAIEAVHLGGCSMLHAALAFGGAGAQ
jgi:hypothetical protein